MEKLIESMNDGQLYLFIAFVAGCFGFSWIPFGIFLFFYFVYKKTNP